MPNNKNKNKSREKKYCNQIPRFHFFFIRMLSCSLTISCSLENLTNVEQASIGCVVLGGTHQKYDYNKKSCPYDAKFIHAGCVAKVAALKNCQVLEEWVGLRPGRKTVRLERDQLVTGLYKSKVFFFFYSLLLLPTATFGIFSFFFSCYLLLTFYFFSFRFVSILLYYIFLQMWFRNENLIRNSSSCFRYSSYTRILFSSHFYV